MSLVRAAGQLMFTFVDVLRPRLQGPRILIYHQVGSGRDHEMNVPLATFRCQIEWLLANGEVVGLEEAIRRRGEAGSERLYAITFDDGYSDVYRNAFPLLQGWGIPFTIYLTSGPIESPDGFPAWPGEPLTWENVGVMLESGVMTLGAHTHTHPDLRQMDPAGAAGEIGTSNEIIERRLGESPRHFTYPKGWWSPSADETVRRVYRTATLGMGDSIGSESDLHKLNRVSVLRSDGMRAFVRKMRGGGRTEDSLRRVKHGYQGP